MEFWEQSQAVEDEKERPFWEQSTPDTESAVFDEKTAGSVYDLSHESDIPLDESEQLHSELLEQKEAPKDGLLKRFGKQLSNFSITSFVRGITSDIFSPIGIPIEEAKTYMAEAEKDLLSRNPNFGKGLPSEEKYQFVLSHAKKIAAERRYEGFQVSQAEGVPEKAVDTVAGVIGFTAQLAILRRVAPSIPDAVAWDVISQANGGGPGSGAAMQVTLGGIGKVIPGAGILPAVERAGATSVLFGTTTYLGGGDTEDILVKMAIPFAFEGAGITKQAWAKYPNKAELFKSLRQKAPALQRISDVELEQSIGNVLTNIEPVGPQKPKSTETMRTEFAPKAATPEISEEVKAFQQQKRYSELLEKANQGDQKAIKELNDYIQKTNLPTYDQLLEKAMKGDQKSVELIQEGNYQGGENAKAELKIPESGKKQPTKPAKGKKTAEPTLGEVERPTPLQRAREATKIYEVDKETPVDIDPAEVSKARERGFITSVKEILPEMKIEGQYIPRSTDQLAIKARNLIFDDIAKAEQVARSGINDKAVATASELVKLYGEKARSAKSEAEADSYWDKSADITNYIAPVLTEAGRTAQAASIVGRQTPEGQLRWAAREIQRYNEKVETIRGGLGGLRKKIPELTAEQAKKILTEMEEIAKMPDGKAKFVRFKKMQDYVSSLVPTPLYDKIVTAWKAGLLTGIKTSGLNITSNIHNSELEIIKDIPASAVDKIVSYFTGKRTVTPNIRGVKEGMIEGFGKGLEYIKSGYSERDIGVKLDYHKTNYNTRAMRMYTEGIFRVLGAEDQPFYYAAKLRSMYEQAKVSAINLGLKGQAAQKHVDKLIENPTELMIKNASKDAEAAVFINNTTLGDIARGIQRLPGGEFVVPFGRTPSAVAMQVVNYSPVGIVKTIVENIGKGRFDQRAFSQGIGRGVTGIPALFMGAKLYSAGLITLDRPKDENEQKLWELEGRQANSILIDGKWRTVQALGPAGNLLLIGGHFQRAFEETGSPTEAMSEAIAGSAKSFTEQTFMRGVSQFVDALSDPERSASTMFGNTLASVIPTIVSDTARATDTTERRADTAGEKVLAKIPGARKTLEPKVTVLGEEKEPTANPLELMIDPTRPSKEISTPVIDELRRLWDEGWEVSPALLGDRKGFTSLTPEENTELWKRTGSITNTALEQLVTNPLYPQLTDQKKSETVTDIIQAARKASRTEMVAKQLSGLEGKELTDKIFELRESGLATEEIIPVALSRRNPRKARKDKE
jgi:hypothetical protein